MRRVLYVAALILGGALSLIAQTPDGPGTVSRGSYSSNGPDSINLYNGNLHLDIPVFSRPGRELSSGISLSYNSQGWHSTSGSWGPGGVYLGGFSTTSPAGGINLFPYLIDCEYDSYDPFNPSVTGTWAFDLSWIDGSGATHNYPVGTYANSYLDGGCSSLNYVAWSAIGGVYVSDTIDDTSTAVIDSSGGVSIMHADGKLVTSGTYLASRNGNYEDPFGLYGDTLGRTISVSSSSSSGTATTTYTLTDSSGSSQNYVFHYTTLSIHNPTISMAPTENWLAITSVDLPTGRSYTFDYEHYQGFLTKVHLPTGGYIAFDYVGGNTDVNVDDNYVLYRRVSANGTGSDEVTWHYERSDSMGTRTVTVTDPDGHQIVHTFAGDVFETETDWKETSTLSPTKTVTTTWTSGQPTEVVTQLGSVKQKRTMTWTGQQVTESTQSDWYTGSTVIPLTKTTTSYTSPTTAVKDIFPDTVELFQWDGTDYNIQQGKTKYFYDEYSLTSRSGTIPGRQSLLVTARNNLTTVRHYYDSTHYLDEHFHYDVLGNMVEHVDERGKSTTYDFTDNFSDYGRNTFAYAKSVTDAVGHTATTVYNFDTGLPMSQTDARGKTTSLTYDVMNRSSTISGPVSGSLISYSYSDGVWPSSVPTMEADTIVASGKALKTMTSFDGLGRRIQDRVFDPDPDSDVNVDTVYDSNGLVKKVSEPYRSGTPVWTQTAVDVLGRPVSVTNPDSTTPAFTYSYTDNVTTRTDSDSHSYEFTMNSLGQLTKVREPNPTLSSAIVTEYTYYVFGPLNHVQQNGTYGLSRSFTSDWLGRITGETHPESGTTAYTYDGSLLATRSDAHSTPIVTTYSYDDIGRPTSVSYSDSTPSVTYTYNTSSDAALLTSSTVTNSSMVDIISTAYTYDDAGRLASQGVTFDGVSRTFTSSYTYDVAGRLLTATYPSGRVVTNAYVASGGTAADRLDSINDGATSTKLLQKVHVNPAGLITDRTLSSGIGESRSFNSSNQLTRIAAAAGDTTLLDLSYVYGTANNGRIVSRSDAVQPEHSANYSFDAMGRLTAAGNSVWGISWTLDAYGNRLTQSLTGLTSTLGSPTNTYGSNKIDGVDYDENGNLTHVGTDHYYYDAENRINEFGSTAIQYSYDEQGRRFKKVAGGYATYYLYGLTGLMSEFSTDDTVSDHTGATSTDRVEFRIGEQTGTAIMLVASDGTPRENNRVFPFGEPWNVSVGSTNRQTFTAYQRDGESDLDYAMARYYDSRGGRFLTPDPGHIGADPSNPQSWNAYVYGLSDPINNLDPSGTSTAHCNDRKGAACVDTSGTSQTVTPDQSWWSWLVGGGAGGAGGGDPLGLGPCFDVDFTSGSCVPKGVGSATLIQPRAQNTTRTVVPASGPPPDGGTNAKLTHNSCIWDAILSWGGSMAIDAIGLIPEAEGFTKVYENTAGYQVARAVGNNAGYRGVVATQYGMTVVRQGKGGMGILNGALGLNDTSIEGRISTGLTIAGFIPGVGEVAAVGSMVMDTTRTAKAISQCP